jgi:hypothetical protein
LPLSISRRVASAARSPEMVQIGGSAITALTTRGASDGGARGRGPCGLVGRRGPRGGGKVGTVVSQKVQNPVCLCESLTRADGTGETGTGIGRGSDSGVARGNVEREGRSL